MSNQEFKNEINNLKDQLNKMKKKIDNLEEEKKKKEEIKLIEKIEKFANKEDFYLLGFYLIGNLTNKYLVFEDNKDIIGVVRNWFQLSDKKLIFIKLDVKNIGKIEKVYLINKKNHKKEPINKFKKKKIENKKNNLYLYPNFPILEL
jgi:hypothetical protein